jgi:hypothetical protein
VILFSVGIVGATRSGRWLGVLILLVVCAGEFLGACSLHSAPLAVSAAPSKTAAAMFPDNLAPLLRYRSKRFALSLALPDGPVWRIDDHSQPELVATHALTRSKVVVTVFHADEIVGRAQCEALSRARKIVPTGDLRTLEDEASYTQQTFDTRVWVAVEPGAGPNGSLIGYVMAFGGFLRKCFAFVFSTQVDDAAEEPVLASRLAFARARILGELALDDVLRGP